MNLEIARQFAREKQLPLIECNLDSGASVESAFTTLVDKIMMLPEGNGDVGGIRWGEGGGGIISNTLVKFYISLSYIHIIIGDK